MKTLGTSIYIARSRWCRLQNRAKLLNIPLTELLSILLQKSRQLFGKKATVFQKVQYQHDCDESIASIMHVDFYEADYEFATSRRYLFKISVSFLISLAIDFFIDHITTEDLLNDKHSSNLRYAYTTNYIFQNFSIPHFETFSAELWIIPWPKEP